MPPHSWHVHASSEPYCDSYSVGPGQNLNQCETLARDLVEDHRENGISAAIAGPFTFDYRNCPYRKEMVKHEAAAAARPTLPATPGPIPMTAVKLSEITCDQCGEPMDAHEHPTRAGGPGASSAPSRGRGPRKPPSVRPPCPYCGGPLHWNEGGGKVNFECLFRQMSVANGRVADPVTERLPVAEAADFVALGTWISQQVSAGVTLMYGKSAEEPATYSALRPKHSAAPAPAPTAPVPSITEVAAAVPTEPPTEPAPDPEEQARATAEERTRKRRELLKSAKRR